MSLRDIPDAVKAYLNTQVTVTITQVKPAGGTTITPNEEFDVHIKATNATTSTGVRLKNVRYRVSFDNPTVADFNIPQDDGTLTNIAGGEKLFTPEPEQDESTLGVGESDTIILRAKAGSAAGGGTTTVRARVLADIDLDSLFPKGEDTPVASKTVNVIG